MSLDRLAPRAELAAMSIYNPRALGPVFEAGAVAFRVWAPFADRVAVVGEFNDWDASRDVLDKDETGCWSGRVAGATDGQRYQYEITNGERTMRKNDPYARALDDGTKTSVLHEDRHVWQHPEPVLGQRSAIVLYEIHVGTFIRSAPDQPGTLANLRRSLPYLAALGIDAIELMPISAFPTELSWGYNTTNPFAIESSYGGPEALRELVDAAHGLGIGVIIDVTYNHLGPADLDLWQFDGWTENDMGGIYFYNDARASTPWGDNRPDYGRAEVRQYLRDNALMWFDDFKVDGLRLDGTKYMRDAQGQDQSPASELPEGWSLMQWLNEEIHAHFPHALTIAEDMADNAWLTRSTGEGGAGFDAQWDVGFVHRVRAAVQAPLDEQRSMASVAAAILGVSGEGAHQRVVYSESHDEVANGRARVPSEITPDDPASALARRRSMLAATIAFTTPGIPMLFAGQEVLEDGWFRDDVAVDWTKLAAFPDVHQFYRGLIALRQDTDGARGLSGQFVNVFEVDDNAKVIAYHRFAEGGPGDDVVVVANFGSDASSYRVGLPRGGLWRVRLDTGGGAGRELTSDDQPWQGLGASAEVQLGAYAIVVLSFVG